jgi:hypothetical protein
MPVLSFFSFAVRRSLTTAVNGENRCFFAEELSIFILMGGDVYWPQHNSQFVDWDDSKKAVVGVTVECYGNAF